MNGVKSQLLLQGRDRRHHTRGSNPILHSRAEPKLPVLEQDPMAGPAERPFALLRHSLLLKVLVRFRGSYT